MQILPNAKSQFIDSAGQPLSSGTVGFYFPGTLNTKPTYQDAAGTIANTNPVPLDSRGQALIWGSGVYRQIVKDASGVTIWDQVTEDSNSGLIGNITNAKFVGGTDFTPGTTTQLTLPVQPGAIANMWVHFDAAYQADDQIASLNGTTLTFNNPIPIGVQEVNIKIGTTIAVGVPGSGSVTDSSLAAGSRLDLLVNKNGVFPEFFGAKADGVTDDTAAIQTAINFAQDNKVPLYLTPRIYSTDTVFTGQPSQPNPIRMVGAGFQQTTLKKRTADGRAVIQIGDPTRPSFVEPSSFENICFDGVAGNSVAAALVYNLVRSTFEKCTFQNALDGYQGWGGISNVWRRCTFQNNQRGWVEDAMNSLYAGGWPNLLTLDGCLLINNTLWGGWADNFRSIYVRGGDIEGNGTHPGNNSEGGFHVGANVNAEGGDPSGASVSFAASFEAVWFEANTGTASVLQRSGMCVYRDSIAVANPGTTFDIQIEGGRYSIHNFDCQSSKTSNIFEDAVPGVAFGNEIWNTRAFGILVNSAKTLVHDSNHNTINARNGVIPVVTSLPAPLIQEGAANPTGGSFSVTFGVPYAGGTSPNVQVTQVNNSPTTVESLEISSITNTGFSGRVKTLTSGSSTVGTSNPQICWLAIGTTL